MFRRIENTKNSKNKIKNGDKPGKPHLKDTGRIACGFKGSPIIWTMMKNLSAQLHVPFSGLIEHALQLGAEQIADALKDPVERELLRDHIIEMHRSQRPSGDPNRYDEDVTTWLDEKRARHFELELLIRNLQGKYASHGVHHEDLDGLIEDGMRYRIAMAKGQSRAEG
jgi:hypothetical protein